MRSEVNSCGDLLGRFRASIREYSGVPHKIIVAPVSSGLNISFCRESRSGPVLQTSGRSPRFRHSIINRRTVADGFIAEKRRVRDSRGRKGLLLHPHPPFIPSISSSSPASYPSLTFFNQLLPFLYSFCVRVSTS